MSKDCNERTLSGASATVWGQFILAVFLAGGWPTLRCPQNVLSPRRDREDMTVAARTIMAIETVLRVPCPGAVVSSFRVAAFPFEFGDGPMGPHPTPLFCKRYHSKAVIS
jgi:hypothetical protein